MISGLLFSFYAHAATPHLTLADYLEQVRTKSPTSIAGQLHSEGGRAEADGDEVLTFPYLFGSATAYDDQAQPALPAVQGVETKANAYSIGAGVNTEFGLGAKYSWNSGYTNVIGLTFPTIGNYTSYNKLDFILNLGRNGLGSEIRAKKAQIRSGNTAIALAGDYQLIANLSQAEATYWRLALARQAVLVQREVRDRATKLLDWAKRRVGLQLGDRSDLLQAQASVDLHNLDLSTAEEEEKNSARAFNLLRNAEGEHVPEAVALPSLDETLRMSTPEKNGERLDVQAAAEKTKATQAQSQLDKEQLKPNVDVTASYAWNGRDLDRGTAINDAFKSTHPTKSIGVTFSVPLDVPTWKKGIRGADQENEAAEWELTQTRLAEARDWNDLTAHLDQARARLEILRTIESVQKDKFDHERERLLRGRTTTFQTITFEQDYASAQLLRLKTQADVLQTLAQMKSFRGKP
jgi:outer membrane protein TolC